MTILEFSDFQCPFCQRGSAVVKQILKAYKGKVRFVFRNMPLDFHQNAHLAAQAALAAHAQGKFGEYRALLFANQERLGKVYLLKYAKQLKLDVKKFQKALDAGTYKKHVDADMVLAKKYGVSGTPYFRLKSEKYSHVVEGAYEFEHFKGIIDTLLAGKKPASPKPQGQPSQPGVAKPAKPIKIDLGSAVSFGPKKAKVTIVEFTDFECPFCAQGAEIVKQVRKLYKDKVLFVFKNMPLNFHPNAHLAAQAALAAHAQGKFWRMHDLLFANQEKMKKADLLKYAKQLKLDMVKFKKSIDSGLYKKQVDAELAQAQQAGVDGTPTFFVNGYKVEGAQPVARFKEIIDALLAGKAFPAVPPEPQQPQQPQAPAAPKGPVSINLKGAASYGRADSKVTVVEFSDFECPFCGAGAKLMKQLKASMGDRVRFVFKHLPLPFHKKAHLAAQASMAAGAQGKFWEYHDLLFANQEKLDKANLLAFAKQLKLDVKKFRKALDAGTFKAQVDADLAEAQKIRVGGTPTFYVNGLELANTPDFPDFKKMLEELLKKAKLPKKQPVKRPIAPRIAPSVRPQPRIR